MSAETASIAPGQVPTAPSKGEWLAKYFRSGWAFFVPYLLVYLVFAWLKWPVHRPGQASLCLENAYLLLHFGHAAAGLVLLWTGRQGLLHRVFDPAGGVLPWLLLGAVLWLTGGYWEFPNDTWEHYLRINDWNLFDTVLANSGWRKSSYFLAYTLVGHLPADRQIAWLDTYCGGMAFALCWQYYRLAREASLSHGAAFAFVLLQLLLFGNSSFSFHRYYGMGSTVPAQIAAVALVRLGLCLARRVDFTKPSLANLGQFFRAAPPALCLLALMAFNHPQAAGIALLGLIAAGLWRVTTWNRTSPFWLAGALIVASTVWILVWPPNPVLRDVYRPAGWMSSWYGFNILATASPAGQRSLQILGATGLANLLAGAWLLRRNHPAGWLTLTPILALLCPVFAIPFATLLAKTSADYILVFSRMLLAIPAGLALVVAGQQLQSALTSAGPGRWTARIPAAPALLLLVLALLILIPGGAPFNNRFWHALAKPPEDLALRHVIAEFSRPDLAGLKDVDAPHFVTTEGLGFAAAAVGFQTVRFTDRLISYPRVTPPATMADRRRDFISGPPPRPVVLFVPDPLALYSPVSLAGCLSGHWLPQEVALLHATSPESAALALGSGGQPTRRPAGTFYLIKH